MSGLPFLHSLRCLAKWCSYCVDLFLILLGALLAFWLVPGMTEGPGL